MAKEVASEVSDLVRRLRIILNTLLEGRSSHGRFTAVILVKAFVDVGGWEWLRLSEPWVRGLLSILKVPPLPFVQPSSLAFQALLLLTDMARKMILLPRKNSA
jgi:hypothetical protein